MTGTTAVYSSVVTGDQTSDIRAFLKDLAPGTRAVFPAGTYVVSDTLFLCSGIGISVDATGATFAFTGHGPPSLTAQPDAPIAGRTGPGYHYVTTLLISSPGYPPTESEPSPVVYLETANNESARLEWDYRPRPDGTPVVDPATMGVAVYRTTVPGAGHIPEERGVFRFVGFTPGLTSPPGGFIDRTTDAELLPNPPPNPALASSSLTFHAGATPPIGTPMLGRAILELADCFNCTITGGSFSSTSKVAAGVRISSLPLPLPRYISTRNALEDLVISGAIAGPTATASGSTGTIQVGIELVSLQAIGNNDFHRVEGCTVSGVASASLAVDDVNSVGQFISGTLADGANGAQTCRLAPGSTTLELPDSGLFDWDDVGRVVEVFTYEPGTKTQSPQYDALRATITAVANPNRVLLDAPLVAHPGAPQVIRGLDQEVVFGSQIGLRSTDRAYSNGGSFTSIGGGVGSMMRAALMVGIASADAVSSYGADFEGCRTLLAGTATGTSRKRVVVESFRFPANTPPTRPPAPAVDWANFGILDFRSGNFGEGGRPLTFVFNGQAGDAAEPDALLSMTDIVIDTIGIASVPELFAPTAPNLMHNVRWLDGARTHILGNQGETYPTLGLPPALSWGRTTVISIVLDKFWVGDQFQIPPFGAMPEGLGTPVRLILTYKKGSEPDTIHWPNDNRLRWPNGLAPAKSPPSPNAAGDRSDIFEFTTDGTIIYGYPVVSGLT